MCRSAELGTVNLSSGILCWCWCWCKDFCSKVREGCTLSALPFLGQGSFLSRLPLGPGLCQARSPSSFLAVVPSLQGLRGTPAFPRGVGEQWVLLSLLHQPNTRLLPLVTGMMSEPFTHLPFAYLLLSFLIVNALKRNHKMEVSPGWKKRKCCCNWEHGVPPKRRPHFSITAFIVASPRSGCGSFLSSFPLRQEGVPVLICFPWRQVLQSICTLFRV